VTRVAERAALAFAVGSSVYFWFQFKALAEFETQVNTAIQPLTNTLQAVGVNTGLTPSGAVTAIQQQAPVAALVAAAATFAFA